MKEWKQGSTVLTGMMKKEHFMHNYSSVLFFPPFFAPNWVVRKSKWRPLVNDGFAACINSLCTDMQSLYASHFAIDIMHGNVLYNPYGWCNLWLSIIYRTVHGECHVSSTEFCFKIKCKSFELYQKWITLDRDMG